MPIFRLLLVLLALLLGATHLGAVDADVAFELSLTGGLHNIGEAPDPDGRVLLLDLARDGGSWETVWGVARSYNIGIHSGRVASATVADDRISLQLEMKIEGDAWVSGGRAIYDVSLARAADGTLDGTLTGTFRGEAIHGHAAGRIHPPVATAPGYIPVQPGEHPRVLFRATDLPALRAKADTAFGKMALAMMGGDAEDGDAIGLGLKYQLTGDRAFAVAAKASVEKHMANQGGGALAIGRAWGPRQEQVAIAYDLCYDAWTPEFKKTVESYLRWITDIIFTDQSKLSHTINWNVTSNYAGPIYAGAAFAGLALWGEKGPEPTAPQPPAAIAEIAPAAVDWRPAEGVPMVALEPGISPRAWLATQALPQAIATDPMQTLGGKEADRPAPGAVWTIDDIAFTWQALDPRHLLEKGGISLEKGLETGKALTCFFHTVLDNREARLLKLRAPFSKMGRVQVVLNGQRLAHEQVVRLAPGRYPLTVALRLGAKWGSLEPWFDLATDADLATSTAHLGAQRAEYEAALKDWQAAHATWQRLGGTDPGWTRLFQQGRRMMYLFAREGLGRGGYQAESGSYFQHAISGPNRYHSAYLSMFGRPLSTLDDMSHYLPRLLCATAYTSSGTWRNQGINAHLELDPTNIAALFPLVPQGWRPGVLWAWNLHVGGDAERPDLAKIIAGDPVQAFLRYPLDLTPLPPGRSGFPLNWEAPDFGYFSYRNAWAGEDDIILQAFGRCRRSGGWGGSDGGTFRLLGFGQIWANGNEDRETRRYLESVVLFPENEEYATDQLGRLVHSAHQADGSGRVSFDLSDLTLSRKDKADWPKMEPYGGIRHFGKAKPAAHHQRAFAVDYSGKCGAPLLLAIVDRIEGGGPRQWLWQLDSEKTASVERAGFRIVKGDALLQAHFIAPSTITVVAEAKHFDSLVSAGAGAGVAKVDFLTPRIAATPTDPTAKLIFMVATLGRGAAPEVSVIAGETPTAIIGGRKVWFDGTDVHIEDR